MTSLAGDSLLILEESFWVYSSPPYDKSCILFFNHKFTFSFLANQGIKKPQAANHKQKWHNFSNSALFQPFVKSCEGKKQTNQMFLLHMLLKSFERITQEELQITVTPMIFIRVCSFGSCLIYIMIHYNLLVMKSYWEVFRWKRPSFYDQYHWRY